jgi:prepilin-type N-terminal cleavage/methylation domain-containing protein
MGIGDSMQVMRHNRWNNGGFTLVEILVAIAITLVVMGSIFYAFKSQQDSYVVQSQVTTMQQTLRGGMYMLTRDVQMAGYYTNFASKEYTMSWANNEDIRPVLHAWNDNSVANDGIRDGTDIIFIVKASLTDGRQLYSTEEAYETTLNVGASFLNPNYSGVLVLNDLSQAEFFELGGSGNLVVNDDDGKLDERYSGGDWIHSADVIRYYIDDDPDRPGLRRHNIGNNESAGQLVAENIENLQIQYQVDTGTSVLWVNDPHNPPRYHNPPYYTAADVRAVRIFLVARTDHTIRGWNDTESYPRWDNDTNPYTPPTADSGFRRKVLCTTTEIRNIGS